MPKRLTAALVALLTFAPALAVVAGSPAAAHTQTKQRCAYDPFAGNQCWTETVAHTHTPPPCPAGTTGTYPNCYPIPSGNEQNTGDEEAKQRAEEARRKAEEAKRKADAEAERKRKEAEAKAKAEAERKRKEAEAKKKAEEQAQTGTGTGTDTGTDTGTTSNDPCGDYAENLVNALSQAAHGAAYNPPTKPDGCGDLSTKELIAKIKTGGDVTASALKRMLEYVGKQEREKSENSANHGAVLVAEIEKLWDKTPAEAKAFIEGAAKSAACGGLIYVAAKTTVASFGAAAPAWVVWAASPGGAVVLGSVCGGLVEAAQVAVNRWSGDGQQPNNPQPDGDGTNNDDDDEEQPISDAEARRLLDQIEKDFSARKITANEANEAHNRIRCRQGHWSCRQ